jgi:GR25 family glycosyltransferase involved in LPS biosynthesis
LNLDDLGRVLFINLTRRVDRLYNIREQSEKFGFSPERIEAVDSSELTFWHNLRPGEAALLLSHKKALLRAIEYDLSQVVILEDDCEMVSNFNERLVEFNEVPDDWEMVYLGCNSHHLGAGAIPEEGVTENVFRAFSVFCTHALILKSSIFEDVIKEIDKLQEPLDVIYKNLIQSRGTAYGFKKNLVKQIDSHSDIIGFDPKYNLLGIFD